MFSGKRKCGPRGRGPRDCCGSVGVIMRCHCSKICYEFNGGTIRGASGRLRRVECSPTLSPICPAVPSHAGGRPAASVRVLVASHGLPEPARRVRACAAADACACVAFCLWSQASLPTSPSCSAGVPARRGPRSLHRRFEGRDASPGRRQPSPPCRLHPHPPASVAWAGPDPRRRCGEGRRARRAEGERLLALAHR